MDILREAVSSLVSESEDINRILDANNSAESSWIRDVDADMLLPRVASMITQSMSIHGRGVRWHAECQYVICMCDQSFMLGPEGYALTTIMQSLKMIVHGR